MKQFILIKHINVQDANAIAGFTWGFPAITHFLGYVHALQRRLNRVEAFEHVSFKGCAVIVHEHHVKTYKEGYLQRFTQSRNPPYLNSHAKVATPPVIEEGKMNMVVSLLIELTSNIVDADALCNWLAKPAQRQRLAGGSILSINKISSYTLDHENPELLKRLKRELLPGFVLLNRCDLLAEHFEGMDENAQLFDAWKDFVAFKRCARPNHDEITKHLKSIAKNSETDKKYSEIWQSHLGEPYKQDTIPQMLKDYFSSIEKTKETASLLKQWGNYCQPTEKTPANWEYQPKPSKGYLIPIMCGYKAISNVQKNKQVSNTRDHKTDVCFVEAAHSIGEWRSVHRWHDVQAISHSIWQYHYTKHWYLCCHEQQILDKNDEDKESTNTNQDISDW